MRKLICSVLFALISFSTIAQDTNRTLLTIGNEAVSVDDFLTSLSPVLSTEIKMSIIY